VRSTRGAVARLTQVVEKMGITMVALELTQPSFFHLDLCFSFLNCEAAIAHRPAFSNSSWELLRERIPRVYEISQPDVYRFVCNGVVSNHRFVTPFVGPSLELALNREHLEPAMVSTSEFEKSGGSVACLHQVIPF